MYANVIDARNAFEAKVAEVTRQLDQLPPGAGLLQAGNALLFRSVIEELPGVWWAQVKPTGEILWDTLLQLSVLSAGLDSVDNDIGDWIDALTAIDLHLENSQSIQFTPDYLVQQINDFS